MALFIQLLSGLVCLSIVLLVALYVSWIEPVQGDDETNEEFKKRYNNYSCKYEGQKNLLLVSLGVSMISCLYKLCTNKEEKTGGIIENMGSDEKNLFVGGNPNESNSEFVDDNISIISDNNIRNTDV